MSARSDKPAQPEETSMRTDDDLDPSLAAAFWRAYGERVDVDTAARHLWRVDRAGRPARRRRGRRALVGVLMGLMMVASSGGALAASSASVPGDALYPVKRGVEKTRLLLAVSSERDARIHLAMARARLAEVDRALQRRPRVIPGLVHEAVDSIESAALRGGAEIAPHVEDVRREVEDKIMVVAGLLDAAELVDLHTAVGRLGLAVDDVVIAAGDDEPDRPDDEGDRATTGLPEVAEPTPSENPAAVLSPSPTPTETVPESPSPSPSPTTSTTASPGADPSESAEPDPSESAEPDPSESVEPDPSESAEPVAEPDTDAVEPHPEPSRGGHGNKHYEAVEHLVRGAGPGGRWPGRSGR
jgi:hypothetical protein